MARTAKKSSRSYKSSSKVTKTSSKGLLKKPIIYAFLGVFTIFGLAVVFFTRAATSPVASSYFTSKSIRVVDTRKVSNGRLSPGGKLEGVKPFVASPLYTQVQGDQSAAKVTGVVMNISILSPTENTSIKVWQTGTTEPQYASLYASKGISTSNEIVIPINPNIQAPTISFANSSGSIDVVGDLVGYYSYAGNPQQGVTPPTGLIGKQLNFVPDIRRVLDTRSTPPKASPTPISISLDTAPNKKVAVVNVTALAANSPAGGFYRVYPGDIGLVGYNNIYNATPPTVTSNASFSAGNNIANEIMAPMKDGKIQLWSSASVDTVVDLIGYYASSDKLVKGRNYILPTAVRVYDTISPTKIDLTSSATSPVSVTLAGKGGLPATVQAAIVNVTVNPGPNAGYIRIYPSGSGAIVSNINFMANQTVANQIILPVGPDGKVNIKAFGASAATSLSFDVVGYTLAN